MAKVEEGRLKEGAIPEMVVTITGTQSRASYEFVLKRRHIEVNVKAPPSQASADGKDWFTVLTDAEKTQVFAIILNQYRKRSLGDNGFKGACIGVAEDKQRGQSRLFIGTNTTRWASPYFKHCAEQNMVNAATDTLMYERSLKPDDKQRKPKAPEFKSVYVLQATDDGKVAISCPCGKCTDMLANVMTKDGSGFVTTLPLASPEMLLKISKKTDSVAINETASHLDQIPLPEKLYTVWKTPIETLNRKRLIELDKKTANAQRDGMKCLADVAALPETLPKDRAAAEYQELKAYLSKSPNKYLPEPVSEFVTALLNHVKATNKLISNTIRVLLGSTVEPAQKAAENVFQKRKSEAVLDCAITPNDTNYVLVNKFLKEKIDDTIADRMRSPKGAEALKELNGKTLSWIKRYVTSVRCVAIQMEDGTFRYAVQADTAFDNAMPNAEVVALENASETLGRCGVKSVWAQEFNPEDIEKGWLRTSPKEGIERLLKRSGNVPIEFHFIPYNNGVMDEGRLRKITKKLGVEELYPSNYKGAGAGSREGHQRASDMTGSWTDFIRNAASPTLTLVRTS